jgi:ammonia channel protein AmtB
MKNVRTATAPAPGSAADLFAFLKWVTSSRARSQNLRRLLCVAGGVAALLVGVVVVGVAVSGLSSAAAGLVSGAAVGYGCRARRRRRN